MKEKVESPCLDCENMVQCKKMCYKRLEWSIFEADKDDEELNIYGNNLEVKGSQRIKKQVNIDLKYEDKDEIVKELLEEFDNIYKKEVVGYILSKQ